MLELKNLSISHHQDLRDLITDLHLNLHPGDKLAVIGEEGTGKSSLIKAIVDPQSLARYAHLQGQITTHFSTLAYLPQHLEPEKLSQEVSDFLQADRDYTLFDYQTFYSLLDQFDLKLEQLETRGLKIANLSGGERLKVQLLKLLSHNPDFLVLDEPSSDLDAISLEWLERFIENCHQAVLFISHDEAFLEKTATAILHLELLKKRTKPRWTYFKGNYTDYKLQRQEKFKHQLQLANKEREEHQKKLARHQRIHQSVEHHLRQARDASLGRFLAKKMRNVLSQEKRYAKEAENFTEIPQDMESIDLFFSDIKPLSKQKNLISWENKVLDTGQKISLHIKGQDKLVIRGKNGIGKTGLLKKILEELSQRTDISLGYMPQHYEELLHDDTSALDFLKEVSNTETARNLLASLRFTREEILHPVSNLSGGQKAKLFLAKMVISKNTVLILDEPTRHFSPTSQPLIRELLKNFPGAIISVSHDRKYIQEVPEFSYHLDNQKLILEKQSFIT